MTRMQIGIYIYDGAEVLDFSGPYEVFSTASRIGPMDLQPRLLASGPGVVTARGGLRVLPDEVIGATRALDVLIVAGGEHERDAGLLPFAGTAENQHAVVFLDQFVVLDLF